MERAEATLLNTYGPANHLGDATVPLVAAIPSGLPLDTNTVRRVPDIHGNLQRNDAALHELEGILTASPVIVKGESDVQLSVDVADFVTVGEDLVVTVILLPGVRAGLHATLRPAGSTRAADTETRVLRPIDGAPRAVFDDLRPGAYTLDVTGTGPGSNVSPASATTLVWDPKAELRTSAAAT